MKVRTELINFADGITLDSGDRLEKFELMIETYGELNESGSNAILLCHAFQEIIMLQVKTKSPKLDGGMRSWVQIKQ